MRYAFIDAQRDYLDLTVSRMCILMQVSSSGYYNWRNRGASQRQLDDMILLTHIISAYKRSGETYGAVRIWHDLLEENIQVGRDRIARLMHENGMFPSQKQRFKKTTDSNHTKDVAPNILKQNFTAAEKNQKWVADISYIWTTEGWLYLAVVLDLYSRRVIGWATDKRMKTDLPLRALERAIALRQPPVDVIHHSDRGSQYCSDRYQQTLAQYGFQVSMSGKGNCYDNAAMETFFKTIKADMIWRTVFMSRDQATRQIGKYIDGFYNPTRRHSTLGFTSPMHFEMIKQ